MSAAAAVTAQAVSPPKGGKKKKLIVIGVAVLVVLLVAGAGGAWWLKTRAAHAAEADDGANDGSHVQAAKGDRNHAPAYLPLEPFVVNLSDRDADRYAQVGVTLELESPGLAEQVKLYMPAIRNAVLMTLSSKSAHDLLDRAGKEQLAEEIMREAVRPMGIDIPAPPPMALAAPASAAASGAASGAPSAGTGAEAGVPKTRPKQHADGPKNPIIHVHFSSFVIQ